MSVVKQNKSASLPEMKAWPSTDEYPNADTLARSLWLQAKRVFAGRAEVSPVTVEDYFGSPVEGYHKGGKRSAFTVIAEHAGVSGLLEVRVDRKPGEAVSVVECFFPDKKPIPPKPHPIVPSPDSTQEELVGRRYRAFLERLGYE